MKKPSLFDRLISETSALSATPSNMIPISKGSKKRWKDLACYWDAHSAIFSDVFYVALHHIAWGKYPAKMAFPKSLATLIEEAIKQDPDALTVWRIHPSFRTAFSSVVNNINRGRYGAPINRFIYCRFYSLTIYRNEPSSIDLATTTSQQLRHARKVAEIRHDYHQLREIIELLIPSSTSWTEQQWLSKRHILTAFRKEHNFDCAKQSDDFNRLISMLQDKLDHKPYYQQLFNFKSLPFSIANAIWGSSLVKEISKQFCIVSHIEPRKYRITLRNNRNAVMQHITSSWVYQSICQWRESKDHHLSNAVRSSLMSFAMNIHPTEVKKSSVA